MKTYLKPFNAWLKTLLPEKAHFTLEDGSQSFVVYPTNYVELCCDNFTIQVAHVIYSNMKEYEDIILVIASLYEEVARLSDNTGEFIQIIKVDKYVRIIRSDPCDDFNDDEIEKDFLSVFELIEYLKREN